MRPLQKQCFNSLKKLKNVEWNCKRMEWKIWDSFKDSNHRSSDVVPTRGLHGSKNSYPKRPEICCTEPTRTRILFESGTRTCADPRNALNVLPGPDHYSKVGPEPGWEDTDPTAPVPIATYCTANAIKSINNSPLPDCDAYNPPSQ